MNRLTATEMKILAVLQDGFPATRTPYADMAEKMGVSLELLLDTLQSWHRQGKLRRIGAIVTQAIEASRDRRTTGGAMSSQSS